MNTLPRYLSAEFLITSDENVQHLKMNYLFLDQYNKTVVNIYFFQTFILNSTFILYFQTIYFTKYKYIMVQDIRTINIQTKCDDKIKTAPIPMINFNITGKTNVHEYSDSYHYILNKNLC